MAFLEKIKGRKLKTVPIGTRVEIIRMYNGGSFGWIGNKGTIIGFESRSRCVYPYTIETDEDGRVVLKRSEFKLI